MFSVGFLFFIDVSETRQKRFFLFAYTSLFRSDASDANEKVASSLCSRSAFCFLPRSAKRDRKTYLRSAFCVLTKTTLEMQTIKRSYVYFFWRLYVFYRGRRNETEKLICDRLSV